MRHYQCEHSDSKPPTEDTDTLNSHSGMSACFDCLNTLKVRRRFVRRTTSASGLGRPVVVEAWRTRLGRLYHCIGCILPGTCTPLMKCCLQPRSSFERTTALYIFYLSLAVVLLSGLSSSSSSRMPLPRPWPSFHDPEATCQDHARQDAGSE